MTDLPFEQQILDHLRHPNYRPVKPRVIAKQLDIDEEHLRDVKRAIKRLVKQGRLRWGPKHLVMRGDMISAATIDDDTAGLESPEGETLELEDSNFISTDAEAESDTSDSSQTDETEAPSDVTGNIRASTSAADIEDPEERRAARLAARSQRKEQGKKNDLRITGTFRRARAGFGFVRPKPIAGATEKVDDIYISQEDSGDAASGDVVLVKLSKKRRGPDDRVSGEIVEIIERDTHQFVGTYFEADGQAYVQTDGNIFTQPISVGDPGAKGVVEGDKIVFEMVRFPTHYVDGEGVIVEVLGKRGQPGVDTLSIMREFGLPDKFPEDVLESARQQAEAFDESLDDRLDLTRDTIITIDPVDARDFDDAISLEEMENGHWRLGVHIADVAYFVPLKTPLDREAKERGTSVYLPDRVLPMLPEVISNNLASLQPDRVRYTKTCYIEFAADGMPIHKEVHNGAIKSKRRFTYEEIDEYLADREPWQEKLTPAVFSLVDRMHRLAMILRERRLKRGAIELTLGEIKIDLNKQGEVVGAHQVENTVSHQIIEEFMLAANEATAELLKDRELPFLRRIHGNPDLRKLKALTEFVQELGIATESLESRFEIKRVLAAVKDQPEEHAVNFAVLRSMQKAVYGPQDEGHFALGSRCYCHFTSPIRRYPDLTVHRLLDAIIRGRKPVAQFDEMLVMGAHCSDREQRAEQAERELTKVKLLTFMEQKVGQSMEAVITGVEQFGMFAQGLEIPAEGLIHIRSLQDDYYDYDARTHSLVGRRAGSHYRLGDVVQVEIFAVNVDRRELDLRLVRKVKSAPGRKAAGGKKFRGKDKGHAKGKGSGGKDFRAGKSGPGKKSKNRPGKRERGGR